MTAPNAPTIDADLRPGDRDVVVDGLVAYNVAHGFAPAWRDCDLVLRDGAGAVRGGALAETNAGWCFVKALWVDGALRGQGYGRRLLAAVEDAARERGCLGVYLDTYSFQARPFYERAGYRVFGTLPDHPPGGAKYYLAKRLDRPAPAGERPDAEAPRAQAEAGDGGAARNPACVFCEIVAGRAPASLVYEDAVLAAFMGIQPSAPGECLVIPKAHVDHFTDLPDEVAAHLIVRAQRIGRRVRAVFRPERVGYLVHGYGVAHAHLIVVPQHGPHHLTSDRFARIEGGRVVFDLTRVPLADRAELDAHARLLASEDERVA